MSPKATDKVALRQHFQRRRRQYLQDHHRPKLEARLWGNAKRVFPRASGRAICAGYRNYSNEASLDGLWPLLSGWQVAFPRVEGDELKFYIPQDKEAFSPNQWKILEPEPLKSKIVSLSDCQVVLVPGVAFDRQGGRLGHGKGFYDRALQDFGGLKVGIAFSSQISEEILPADKHDIFMDVIVTDEEILKPNSGAHQAAGL